MFEVEVLLLILLCCIFEILSQCPGQTCWEQHLSASTLPNIVRHGMSDLGGFSFIIYGGIQPGTNALRNDVFEIAVVPGLPASTLCQVFDHSNSPIGLDPRMDHAQAMVTFANTEKALFVHGGISSSRLYSIWRFRLNGVSCGFGSWLEVRLAVTSRYYRYGHTALYMDRGDFTGSRIWFIGGANEVNGLTSDLIIYDPPNDRDDQSERTLSISQLPSIPPRLQHCTSFVDLLGYCFIIYGGLERIQPPKARGDLWIACPQGTNFDLPPLNLTQKFPTNTWDIEENRYSHGCVNIGDRMLVFGGRPDISPPNYANDLIDYDVTLNSWGRVEDQIMFNNTNFAFNPPGRREEMGIGSLKDGSGNFYTYIFAGQDERLTGVNDLWSIKYNRPFCNAGHYSPWGSIECIPCHPGSIPIPNHYTCQNCTAGEYTDGAGQDTCKLCPAGTYSLGPVGNVTECTPCAAGTFSNIIGRTTPCEPCPNGTYSTNSTGNTFCFGCPPGTYNNRTGSILISDCDNCTAGFFAPTGSSQCFQCPGGYYSPDVRQGACTICPAGSWSDIQSTNCTNCTVGRSNGSPGSSGIATCVLCIPGTYADRPGTPACIPCATGKYNTNTGSITESDCLNCPLGTFQNITGAYNFSQCISCPAGTYQDQVGQYECINCPVGRYSESIRATTIGTCLNCPRGTYAPTTGTPSLSSCIDCEGGLYNPFLGASLCLKCPNGTYHNTTKVDARSGCLPCDPNHYSNEGQLECTPCDSSVLTNSTTYTAYSMKGWEQCISCSTETGQGYVHNGHFSHDPVHAYWEADADNTGGCSFSIQNEQLRLVVGNTARTCRYKQVVTVHTLNTFPYHLSVSSRSSSSLNLGTNPQYRAVFVMYLRNGTIHNHTITFTENTSLNTKTISYRPDQVNSKLFLKDLYEIIKAEIFLEFSRIQGTVWWDDIQFSPFSKNMCNCTRTHLDAEYYTIDLKERDSCQRCTVGKFCNGGGIFSCPPIGYYTFGGHAFCRVCGRGLACKDGIATTCGATQFRNVSVCEDCPLNSACRNTDRHICPVGKYGQGLRHCIPCLPGSFCNETGCTSCNLCPAGRTSNFLRTYCYECPVGHFSVSGGPCIPCPTGTYTDTVGTTTCTPCPIGKTTTCSSASSLEQCV